MLCAQLSLSAAEYIGLEKLQVLSSVSRTNRLRGDLGVGRKIRYAETTTPLRKDSEKDKAQGPPIVEPSSVRYTLEVLKVTKATFETRRTGDRGTIAATWAREPVSSRAYWEALLSAFDTAGHRFTVIDAADLGVKTIHGFECYGSRIQFEVVGPTNPPANAKTVTVLVEDWLTPLLPGEGKVLSTFVAGDPAESEQVARQTEYVGETK